jgi:hypothetical protein
MNDLRHEPQIHGGGSNPIFISFLPLGLNTRQTLIKVTNSTR